MQIEYTMFVKTEKCIEVPGDGKEFFLRGRSDYDDGVVYFGKYKAIEGDIPTYCAATIKVRDFSCVRDSSGAFCDDEVRRFLKSAKDISVIPPEAFFEVLNKRLGIIQERAKAEGLEG